MKKRVKRNTNTGISIQLQIDFLLPYELTPTLEDIRYELSLTGTISCPFSIK